MFKHGVDLCCFAVVAQCPSCCSSLDLFNRLDVGVGVGIPYWTGVFEDGSDKGFVGGFLDLGVLDL